MAKDKTVCKHEPGQFIPVIDRNACEGKRACVAVCPYDVLIVGTLPKDQRRGLSLIGRLKGMTHGWQQAFVVGPDRCHACGLCVAACPEDAITLSRL